MLAQIESEYGEAGDDAAPCDMLPERMCAVADCFKDALVCCVRVFIVGLSCMLQCLLSRMFKHLMFMALTSKGCP
jgi:hypothetical protein